MTLSLLFLLAVTALLFRQRKPRPWGFVGWLWFLGALVPSIGFIQVGQQARADRFTYFPQIGFWIAVVWTVAPWTQRLPRTIGLTLAVGLLGLTIWTTRTQADYWKDSVTLFERTMQLAGNDPLAVNMAASNCMRAGEFEKAEAYYKRSIQLFPKDPDVWSGFGVVLARLGKDRESARAFLIASRLEPAVASHLANLAWAYDRLNLRPEAETNFRAALKLEPGLAAAHYRFGLFLERNSPIEALEHLKKAAELAPENVEYRDALADFQKIP